MNNIQKAKFQKGLLKSLYKDNGKKKNKKPRPRLELNANKAEYVVVYFGEDKKTCVKQVIRPSWMFIHEVRGGKTTWGDLVRAVTGGRYTSFDLK